MDCTEQAGAAAVEFDAETMAIVAYLEGLPDEVFYLVKALYSAGSVEVKL